MTRTMNLLMALVLVGTALVAFAPSVAAHGCYAQDPAATCGDCDEGVHEHRYNNGANYCSSSEPSDPPEELTVCDIYRLVYEIFDSSNLEFVELRDVKCDPPQDLAAF